MSHQIWPDFKKTFSSMHAMVVCLLLLQGQVYMLTLPNSTHSIADTTVEIDMAELLSYLNGSDLVVNMASTQIPDEVDSFASTDEDLEETTIESQDPNLPDSTTTHLALTEDSTITDKPMPDLLVTLATPSKPMSNEIVEDLTKSENMPISVLIKLVPASDSESRTKLVARVNQKESSFDQKEKEKEKHIAHKEATSKYVALPVLLIICILVVFVFILASKFSFLVLRHVCPCAQNDSICLFMSWSMDEPKVNNNNNNNDLAVRQRLVMPNENYSIVVKKTPNTMPIVNDLPRSTNVDMSYYGVVNEEDSDDSLMPKNAVYKPKRMNDERSKRKKASLTNTANHSNNKSNFESFRMGSFANNAKETSKGGSTRSKNENNENFYLDIYNSFANLNSPLNEMLYVEDDPLNELDRIETHLSKSVSELNQMQKSVDTEKPGEVETVELYYHDLGNSNNIHLNINESAETSISNQTVEINQAESTQKVTLY